MIDRPVFFGRHSPLRATLLLLLLAAPALSKAQAILANDVVEPRTFGYVVGDKIRREVHISLDPAWRLDLDSLPEPGRVDRWLDFTAPDVRADPDGRARHYRLVLTWQLRNAPAAPETIAIPQLNLRILGEAQALTTLVPALRINVAPLTSAIAAERINGSSLQEDRPPSPLPMRARQTRLAWTGAALLVLLSFAGWRRGLLSPGARANLPFARAVRELKRTQSTSDSAARYPASLKIVHEAINRTAGRAVFAHDLDDFFASHPAFAPLRDDFERLFAASGRVFFGNADAVAPAGAAGELLRLCRRGRRIERQSFQPRLPGRLRAPGN